MLEGSEMRGFGDEASMSERDATLSMSEMVLPAESADRTATYDKRHVMFLILFLTLVCLLLAVL